MQLPPLPNGAIDAIASSARTLCFTQLPDLPPALRHRILHMTDKFGQQHAPRPTIFPRVFPHIDYCHFHVKNTHEQQYVKFIGACQIGCQVKAKSTFFLN
jgi:hypothetical protein